jgi:hypothetical protein
MAVCVVLAAASIAEPGTAQAGAALVATDVSLSPVDTDVLPGGSDSDYEGAVMDIVQHAPDNRGVHVSQARAATPRPPLFSRYVPPEPGSNT